MIHIITGKINSGKSTKLVSIYNSLGKGDGFFNRKTYEDGCYVRQEVVSMSTGESMVWSCWGIPSEQWREAFSYGACSFSKDGLEFAENKVTSILDSSVEPVFIDEIGPLELQEKGFHELFKRCVASGKELYVVIRESCVEAVIKKYNIESYEIIETNTIAIY